MEQSRQEQRLLQLIRSSSDPAAALRVAADILGAAVCAARQGEAAQAKA